MIQVIRRILAHRMVRALGVMHMSQAVQFGCNLLISVLLARYLGPGNLGVLNYAGAMLGFAGTVAAMGLGSIVARDLIAGQIPASSLLSTAFVLRMGTGAIAMIAIVIYALVLEPGELPRLLILIGAAGLVLDMGLVFETSLQAREKFKMMAQAKSVLAVGNLTLIALWLSLKMNLVNLAVAQYVGTIWYLILMAWVCRQVVGKIALDWDAALAWRLLRQGVPLMLATLSVALYARIDQVMIEHLMGPVPLGIYSVSVRLAEAANFFPGIVAMVVFPILVRKRAQAEGDGSSGDEATLQLLALMYLSGFAFALAMTLISGPLIAFLYGAEYVTAAPVLRVYVWSAVFVFIGIAAQMRLLVGADTTYVILVRTLAGALSNILLNFWWIPKFGLLGAAWATVVSYAIAAYFVFDRRYSWPTVRLMLAALHPRHSQALFKRLQGTI